MDAHADLPAQGAGAAVKREASDHPKLWDLVERLPEPFQSRGCAMGWLEAVWHFTAKFTPRGDIGARSDAAIARWVGWPLEPAALVDALVGAGWLDRDDEQRLLVHGWAEHVDDAVHMQLARGRLYFADGSVPKLRRLPPNERTAAEAFYEQHPRPPREHAGDTSTRQGAHGVDTVCARRARAVGEPRPAPPEPEPVEEESRAPPARRSPPLAALRCADVLIECVRQAPGGRIPLGARQRWAAELARIPAEVPELQANGADPWEHIEAAIRWALGPENLGQEYEVVIRSARSLREKWPKLVAAARRQRQRTQPMEELERWIASQT